VIKASATTSATAAVLFPELSIIVQEHGLQTILWVLGALLAIITALLGLICKFIYDMKRDNSSAHIDLYAKIETPTIGIEPRLSHLEGQHSSAMQVRGCAYDPKRLQTMVISAVEEVLDGRKHDCREEDCPLHGKE